MVYELDEVWEWDQNRQELSQDFHLQIIDLNDNTFTEEGSLAMAEVLPDLQDLKVINFGDCLVRSDGARAIAEAIKDGHRQLEVGVYSVWLQLEEEMHTID